MAQPVYADNWEAITGKETLHEFVSGAIVEIDLASGVSAIGSYYADGTVGRSLHVQLLGAGL
jgi:hypothetical protein